MFQSLKDFSKNGILWILFDHIQSSSLNAGYGIAESGRHLIPSVNLPGTVLQRGGSPDCEHRTKDGIKVTCFCRFTFKADDGKYHEWEETTKVILPIKQCDCKNKDKSHEKLPITILKKIYRSSVRCHDFLQNPLISMFDPQVEMGHTISGPENIAFQFHSGIRGSKKKLTL